MYYSQQFLFYDLLQIFKYYTRLRFTDGAFLFRASQSGLILSKACSSSVGSSEKGIRK
jgi:hypothetical protein